MSEQIHGHEVLNMMIASKRAYTREALVDAIEDRFGATARFYTCSSEQMTTQELIDFLVERSKFNATPEGWTVNVGEICDHDETRDASGDE